MPPLMLIAAIGAGCYAGYKLASRWLAADDAPDQAAAEATKSASTASARNLGDLEWDAETGVYRPKRG